MAIDPTKKYSSLLPPQNYSINTNFSDSLIGELFNFIPEQLNELKVSGRDSLFSITQYLLVREDDSSTKKVIKSFFYVVPVIPTVIGATSIIDNICKVFKNDVIQELDKNLIDHYLSSEDLLKELTDPLHYFSSKQYQDLKTELDSNFTNVVYKHKQAENSLSEKKDGFFRKLNEVKRSLNIHLKQSKCGLDKFTKIISEGKSFYTRIENDIKNHKKVIKDYLWFYTPDITTISSEIILPFNLIEKKLLQITHEISPEVESNLLSKIEVFKEKMNGYLDDLKEVTKKIDHLKFKNRKRECFEERLTIKVDSIEVTTYKTKKPEKENKLIDELSRRKSELRIAIQNTADSCINFLDRTYVLLKEDYMSALIEKNKINLSGLLTNAKLHLDSYYTKFPKQEKIDLENLIEEINTLTSIDDLINMSPFKYQGELRKCETLIKENSELIEKTIKN